MFGVHWISGRRMCFLSRHVLSHLLGTPRLLYRLRSLFVHVYGMRRVATATSAATLRYLWRRSLWQRRGRKLFQLCRGLWALWGIVRRWDVWKLGRRRLLLLSGRLWRLSAPAFGATTGSGLFGHGCLLLWQLWSQSVL